MDDSRSHGLSEANRQGLRDYIRGYTLVDITNTGVLAQYRKTGAFMDNANQVVTEKESWERSRNQQRNWETFVQLASMITQPTILKTPSSSMQDLSAHSFSYNGTAMVWEFILGAEQTSVFDNKFPAGRLAEMCHKIPVVVGLKETVDFAVPMFNTSGNINLYFEKVSF